MADTSLVLSGDTGLQPVTHTGRLGPARQLTELPNSYFIAGCSYPELNGIYRICCKVNDWDHPLYRNVYWCKRLMYRNTDTNHVLEWVENTGRESPHGTAGFQLRYDTGEVCFCQQLEGGEWSGIPQVLSHIQSRWFVPPHARVGGRTLAAFQTPPDEVVMVTDRDATLQLIELKEEWEKRLKRAAKKVISPVNKQIGCWVYKVVGDHVDVRVKPKLHARKAGTKKYGDRVNVLSTAKGEGGMWLRVGWEGCPRGDLWMLQDGSALGEGLLLERASEAMSVAIINDNENEIPGEGHSMGYRNGALTVRGDHEETKVIEDEPRQFACSTCGNMFDSPIRLRRHIKHCDPVNDHTPDYKKDDLDFYGVGAAYTPLAERRSERSMALKVFTGTQGTVNQSKPSEPAQATVGYFRASHEGFCLVEMPPEEVTPGLAIACLLEEPEADPLLAYGLCYPVDPRSKLGEAWRQVVLPSSATGAQAGVSTLRCAMAELRVGAVSGDDVAAELGIMVHELSSPSGDTKALVRKCILELELLQLVGLINGNRLTEAEALLRTLEMNGNVEDERVIYWTARVELARGRRDKAITLFLQAGEQGVNLVDSLEKLAQAKQDANTAFHAGMWTEATRAYDAALSLEACKLDTHMRSVLLCNSAASLRMDGHMQVSSIVSLDVCAHL